MPVFNQHQPAFSDARYLSITVYIDICLPIYQYFFIDISNTINFRYPYSTLHCKKVPAMLQEGSGAAPECSSNINGMFQEGSYVRPCGTFHGAFRTISGNGHGTVRRFYSDVVSATFV